MQLLRRHRLPVLLLAAYWVLAMALYLRWERENWYPTTGDEPHHIAIGRSLVHHASLELTDYYAAEAVRQGRPGEIPRPGTFHIKPDGDGLFSVHSIGIGVMAAPAIVLTDVIGYHNDVPVIRVSFVLLSGAAVVAAWVLSCLCVRTAPARVLAVALTCFGLPLLISANQVFPDMPAGIIGLYVLAYIGWRATTTRPPMRGDMTAMGLLAAVPFLHYKLSPVALVLGATILLMAYKNGATWRHILALCVLPALAAALFSAYNLTVDGDLMPTSPDASVHSELTPFVRWMFTFSVDRWHGFFLQNAAFFIGALFYVPFLRAHPIVAVPAMLCFLAAMGINAAHGAPGFSFAGRHAWTGAMMLVPAVIYGVGRIESLAPRVLYALGGVLLALQMLLVIPLTLEKRDLYNQPSEVWFDVYPSFYPEALNRFLPAIYNTDWWSSFALNWVYIGFVAVLIAIGALVYPRRRESTLPAAGGLLAVTLPVIVLVSVVQADPPREPRHWDGSALHRRFGNVLPRTVEAKVDQHSAGLWIFGPYMKVAPGRYRVTFVYSSNASPDTKVGGWDVTGRAGRVRIAGGELYGSNGLRAVARGTINVESRADGEGFEMRTYFDDVADLLLVEIVLEPID